MEPLAEKVAKGAAQLSQSADSLGWLDRRFWGNSISVWLLALVVAAAVAGAFCVHANYSSSANDVVIGGRLSR